ncbi:DUF4382 domain-containing protein [Chloroflexota bacterium]
MVRKLSISLSIIVLAAVCIMIIGCGGGESTTGTLQFYANGEDFVRQGFISKDGWIINFDHVYITLADINAYQTDPPYEPHSDDSINGQVTVSLDKVYTVDLAEGGEDALPIAVDEFQGAPAGHYNAISWKMVEAVSGPAVGSSLVMTGTAEKEGRVVDFTIKIDEECEYSCGEYVGDERKGMVADGNTVGLEMTFHFDHIFGDAETPLDDALNLGAVGFEPFTDTAEGGQIDINMTELHLGHVGEGHCHCICE